MRAAKEPDAGGKVELKIPRASKLVWVRFPSASAPSPAPGAQSVGRSLCGTLLVRTCADPCGSVWTAYATSRMRLSPKSAMTSILPPRAST
jgi:hypothetical protein